MPEGEKLQDETVADLRERARADGISGYSQMTKDKLVDAR